jgi:predicted glycoside hydrolase/deacetylase ChbG (UPF0249 family)
MNTPQHPVSVNERLGYSKSDRLLIINADDAGMCHAVNAGVERALTAGLVTSCTVMTPCPWFNDFAARARRNPALRVGVHLTTTSEWPHYRWGPVADRGKVRSLLDPAGCFYPSTEEFQEHADPAEVEIEFTAQIERVLAAGLRPTHIDSHMGVYHFKDELFAVARKLAERYRLTLRDGYPPRLQALQAEGFCVVDFLFFETHDVPLEQRRELYWKFLDQITPGCWELVIHPAEPTEELRAIGGMWQRRGFDLEFFTNPETRERIAEKGITLVGYDRMQAATAESRRWK